MIEQNVSTFIRVAELGSLTKAASSLYLSPVSVMNQINALEAEVGTKLLDRGHAGCKLTPAGTSLLADIQRLVAESDAAILRARAIGTSGKSVIRVGTSPLRPAGPLMDLWARIGTNLPYRIEIVPFSDENLGFEGMMTMLDNVVDCFISPSTSLRNNSACNVLELGNNPCKVGVPLGHRLYGRQALSWEDLDGEQLMLVRRGLAPVVDAIRDEIQQSHPLIRILNAGDLYSMKVFNTCAAEGFLIEVPGLWDHVHPSIRVLPMDWDYTMSFGILYAKEPTDAMNSFITEVKRAL